MGKTFKEDTNRNILRWENLHNRREEYKLTPVIPVKDGIRNK